MSINKLILAMGDLLSCNLYFVVHTVCYCMDAICLDGNVWINIPLGLGKMVSGMAARCERVVKGERQFWYLSIYISHVYTEVFNGGLALACLYLHILYVCIDVFTFG